MSKPIPKKIIQDHIQKNQNKRTYTFEYEGKMYWLKQQESNSFIKNLLFRNSSKNLIKEKIVLEKLSKQGIPVPDVINFGKDYLILSDVGDAIINIIERRHSYYSNSHPKFHLNGAPLKEKILTKASIALAKLHKMGYAHGRPSIKDICMKNNKIYFIDFEENKLDQNINKQQTRDLLIFIHSLYRFFGVKNESIKNIIKIYQQNGGDKVWARTNKKMQTWIWLRYLFFFFKRSGGKDLAPIYWVFNFFKSQKNL
jgi:tRNA A-37 threonylcarbamoyl transferase component Bud32